MSDNPNSKYYIHPPHRRPNSTDDVEPLLRCRPLPSDSTTNKPTPTSNPVSSNPASSSSPAASTSTQPTKRSMSSALQKILRDPANKSTTFTQTRQQPESIIRSPTRARIPSFIRPSLQSHTPKPYVWSSDSKSDFNVDYQTSSSQVQGSSRQIQDLKSITNLLRTKNSNVKPKFPPKDPIPPPRPEKQSAVIVQYLIATFDGDSGVGHEPRDAPILVSLSDTYVQLLHKINEIPWKKLFGIELDEKKGEVQVNAVFAGERSLKVQNDEELGRVLRYMEQREWKDCLEVSWEEKVNKGKGKETQMDWEGMGREVTESFEGDIDLHGEELLSQLIR